MKALLLLLPLLLVAIESPHTAEPGLSSFVSDVAATSQGSLGLETYAEDEEDFFVAGGSRTWLWIQPATCSPVFVPCSDDIVQLSPAANTIRAPPLTLI